MSACSQHATINPPSAPIMRNGRSDVASPLPASEHCEGESGSGAYCHWGEPAPKGCSVDVWMKWMGPWLKEYLRISYACKSRLYQEQALPPQPSQNCKHQRSWYRGTAKSAEAGWG